MLHRYRSIPLRFRVAITAFILGTLVIIVVVQAAIQVTEDGLRRQFDRRAESVTNVVVTMSTEPLLTGEYARVNEVLQQMEVEDEIGTIDLVDVAGQVVASSDRTRLGSDSGSSRALLRDHSDGPVLDKKVVGQSGELGTVLVSLDTTSLDQLLHDERGRTLLTGLLGVSVVALVSLVGGWGLTRRISDLESQLNNVDADGLPHTVRTTGNDEITRLGRALNERTVRNRLILAAHSQAQDDLRVSESKLQLALAAAADAVVELDPESGEFSVLGESPAGLRLREVGGTDTKPLMERVHPDDRAAVIGTISSVLAGPMGPSGVVELEIRILTSRGTWTDLLLRVQAVAGPMESNPRVLLAMVDVTNQRLIERRLAQADKMQTIGLLTSGIAHDFNNALAVTRLQLSVINRPDRDRSKDDERIEQLSLANDNATAMVKRLLESAAPQPTSPKRVDIQQIIQSLRNVLHTILGADTELRLDLAADDAAVIIDEAGFQQVIINLAQNASDAMNGFGYLSIRAWNPDAANITVEVNDAGPGIDPSVADTLFDPFVTTKPLGAGTGLGLATTHATVSTAGGTIEASRQGEHGATFILTLPLAPESQAQDPTITQRSRSAPHDLL